MLADSAKSGERHDGHKNLKKGPESSPATPGPTLAAIGVTKGQSSKWPQVAALTDDIRSKLSASVFQLLPSVDEPGRELGRELGHNDEAVTFADQVDLHHFSAMLALDTDFHQRWE
jgi:hypothetical protein